MKKDIYLVVSIMRQRRTADDMLIRQMIQNKNRYNGIVVTMTPDVSSLPLSSRPGPNFFQESVDGVARSANQKLPKISCPILDPDDEKEIELASRRQGSLYGSWQRSQLQIKLGRTYRHAAAYGSMAMVVTPDMHERHARIELRDPLTAYPELRSPDDIRPPKDVGFIFARSAQWIKAHYPMAPDYLADSAQKGWDTLWDIVEWIDEDDIIIGVMGPRFPPYGYYDAQPYGYNAFELGRWPNLAGMVPAVVPRRVTLDIVMGQMTSMINYSDLYARMLQLQLVATEKATFPDMVVSSRTGLTPQLLGGRWKDGRTGEVNIIVDGVAEVVGKEPGPGTVPVLQLMDSHIRGTGGASPLYGAQSGGMRTGAGVDALGNFGINPMVAEAQHLIERSLEGVNRAVMAVERGYFGDEKKTTYFGLAGSLKTVTYTPNKDFAHKEKTYDEHGDKVDKMVADDFNVVYYPSPGADENALAVALVQMEAAEIISARTARNLHPLVEDSDQEAQFVSIEKLENAVLEGAANEIAQGQTSTTVAARAGQLIATGKNIFDAWLQANSEAAEQAPATGTPGGAPTPTGPDGQPMPPGLAQMLASQGAGVNTKGQGIVPPGESVPTASPEAMNYRHVLQGVNEGVSANAT